MPLKTDNRIQTVFIFLFAFIGIFAISSYAENNILTLPHIQTEANQKNVLGLELTNQDTVTSVQLKFIYDSTIGINITEAALTSRTDGFSKQFDINNDNPASVEIQVLLFDFSGKAVISPGKGDILEFSYETTSVGEASLAFEEAILSDQNGDLLQSTTQDGSVSIGKQTINISGYVKDSADVAISQVALNFSNSSGSTTTDSSGYYSHSVDSGWSGVVTPVKTEYSFDPTDKAYSNVTSNQVNQNYTAKKIIINHTLSKFSSPASGGSVSASPEKSAYEKGESVTLTAMPDSCYEFTEWSDACSGTNPTCTLTMDSDKSVTAKFSIKTYSLNIAAANGSVTKTPNQSSYNCGTSVKLTATTVSDDYRFERWEGISGTNPSVTVTMNSDHNITAVFELIDDPDDTHTLTKSASSGGVISVSPDKAAYEKDESVTLTAVPDSCYEFTEWSGACSGTSPACTLKMDSDKSVTAKFNAKTYSLTVNAANGTVAKNPNQSSYDCGTLVTLMPMPDSGYIFDHWEGSLTGNQANPNINMNRNMTVTAVFTEYEEPETTQTIPLCGGWNIISSYIIPENPDMETLLQDLIDNDSLVKAIDETGSRFIRIFGSWTNNIGTFNYEKGYKIKVSQDTLLTIRGVPVKLPTSLPLSAGWNIISYPCLSSQDALNAVQPLIDSGNLIKVIDEQGGRIINFMGNWVNTIGDFVTGEGYQIKVKSDSFLTINKSESTQRKRTSLQNKRRRNKISALESNRHFISVWTGNPYNSMNLWLVGINGFDIEPGDEIGVFDGDKCVGAGIVNNDGISDQNPMPVITSQDEGEGNGFTEGHEMRFMIWDSDLQTEISVYANFIEAESGYLLESPLFTHDEDYGVILNTFSTKHGDINRNGTVDLHDAILGLKVTAGMSAENIQTDADVNCDGKIGTEEVIYILHYIMGK
ncbi:MAG: hypothetical protein GY749_15745 [Desulfobacteraceae bacterium]|nr:hypothetical protein [Desulfobacteraceae bacterium]